MKLVSAILTLVAVKHNGLDRATMSNVPSSRSRLKQEVCATKEALEDKERCLHGLGQVLRMVNGLQVKSVSWILCSTRLPYASGVYPQPSDTVQTLSGRCQEFPSDTNAAIAVRSPCTMTHPAERLKNFSHPNAGLFYFVKFVIISPGGCPRTLNNPKPGSCSLHTMSATATRPFEGNLRRH